MTKEIPLTQGMVALVDDADYEWLSQWKWCAAQTHGLWYAMRGTYLGDRTVRGLKMHRVILNAPDEVHIDHKDGNGLNNTRANIRLCNLQQNAYNRSPVKGSSSQYKGVGWTKEIKKWRAQIQADGKNRHIGYFIDEVDAARAYDVKAIELYGEFARLNFPEE